MLTYRIDRSKRSQSVLSGKGAELYGGRWNLPGIAVVYTATSRSLAMLEMLIHLEMKQLPTDRIMIQLELPDAYLNELRVEQLGKGWTSFPYHIDSQGVFGSWLKEDPNLLLLSVPSAIVPEERNILINPLSTHINKIKVIDVKPIKLDDRWST